MGNAPLCKVSFSCHFRSQELTLSLQDDTLTYYAGYSGEEVEPVVQLMVDYLCRPIIHEAFFKKYASKKFLKGTSSPAFSWPSVGVQGLIIAAASILARQWAKKNVELFGIENLDVPVDHL